MSMAVRGRPQASGAVVVVAAAVVLQQQQHQPALADRSQGRGRGSIEARRERSPLRPYGWRHRPRVDSRTL